ncbi:MAG: LytTR family DNA-binding domain-containing protein [Saprospiraceae bacterium]
MILQAIAIDDEKPALDVIAAHIAKVPFVHLQAQFTNPTDALTWLHTNQVDVVFIDIQMPDILGTEWVRMANNRHTRFVFITAHAHYAVEGFELNAFDYILKPVLWPRFVDTCNRLLQYHQNHQGQPQSIFLKDGYDWVRVVLADIEYVRADTNLLFVHHGKSTTITRMTLGQLLDILPAELLLRTHKSYAVAIHAVQKIERHQLTLGSAVVPLSRSYR